MANALAVLQTVLEFVIQNSTAVIWVTLALPFLIVLLLVAIPCLVRGVKQGALQATLSLLCSLVAAVAAIVAAEGLSMLVSGLLLKGLLKLFSGKIALLSESLAQILVDGTYLGALVQWVVSALLATVLFLLFFFALLLICKLILEIPMAKRDKKKEKKHSAFSKFCGFVIRGADAILIAFLFLAPFYTVLGFGTGLANDVIAGSEKFSALEITANVQQADKEEVSEEEQGSVLETVTSAITKVTDPVSSFPLVKAASLPGLDFGTRVFGLFICDGKLYNTYAIAEQGSDILTFSLDLVGKDFEEYGQSEIDTLKKVQETANKNDFYYGVFTDALHIGGGFLEEIYEDAKESGKNTDKLELIYTIYAPFKDCTVKDVQSGGDTLIKLFESTIKNGVLQNVKEPEALLESMNESDFVKEAVTLLRGSELLSDTIDNLLLLSLDYIDFSSNEEVSAEFEEAVKELKDRVKESIESGNADPEQEIYAFQTMISGFYELYGSTDGFKSFSFEKVSSKGIADLLRGLGSHPHIGADGAEDLLGAALPSFGASGTILTDDFIKSAINALVFDINTPPAKGSQGKFENLLFTAQNLTNAIMNGIGDSKDKEALDNTIDLLLSDMTPESAEILTGVITGEVMDSLNGSGASAGETENFVKDLISNMAAFEAESKEELEKEREAIIKMNDLALDAENKLNNKPEGQTSIEAAVGGDLKGFVNDVSSSTVLMGTITDTFERSPEKDVDPTGMFASMGEEDKAKLNEVCAEMLADDGISQEQKENIKTLCSFMGGTVA
jgi:hypothetical protein